jgi:RNA polymerase sigma-70 factor (ECF subfamily)
MLWLAAFEGDRKAAVPPSDEIDRGLLVRMAQRDTAALAQLYDRYARMLVSLAGRILDDPSDAEDVVQESFWQAWLQAGRYDPARGTVGAWLLVITRSRALDRLRARRRRPEPSVASETPVGAHVEIRDPDAGLLAAEQVARLREALRQLPDHQRLPIELAYYEGLSQTEIATRLQEPLGTIKTRMRLAMRRLREALER